MVANITKTKITEYKCLLIEHTHEPLLITHPAKMNLIKTLDLITNSQEMERQKKLIK